MSVCGNLSWTAAAPTNGLPSSAITPVWNPAVSDDGRFIAFQLAKSTEAAGVGHGIFILDLKAR